MDSGIGPNVERPQGNVKGSVKTTKSMSYGTRRFNAAFKRDLK